MRWGRGVRGAVLAVAAWLSGCGTPPDYPPNLDFPPRKDRLVLKTPERLPAEGNQPGRIDAELAALDALGGRTLDPLSLPAEARAALDRFLADTFGTPAAPKVEAAGADALGLTPDRLAAGGKLFRRHCQDCHGLGGDGRGPTGPWIDPHPRDFRRGAFKFVSTGDGGKPRRADLTRTIREGLKGTAMPPFALLPDDSRDLMAGFVTYLSLRGQVEFQALAALGNEAAGEGGVDGDVAGFARERLEAGLREWVRAEQTSPPPGPPPGFDARAGADHEDSVRRGFELFTAKSGAGCAACHEDFGRKPALRFDVWGTTVRPADLTAVIRKGGNRPEDLYQRVRHGIQPVGMPANAALTEPQVWDVVRFVRSVPYPRELPEGVRSAVEKSIP